MPMYDFICKENNHTFEEFCFIKEDNPICPVCGSVTVKQIGLPCNWYPASAVFTNKGWDKINKQANINMKNGDDLK